MRKPKFLRPCDTGVRSTPEDIHKDVLRATIGSTTHPEKDRLLGQLRAGQWTRLLEWADTRPSPQSYATATDYYVECQIAALLRKYPFNPTQIPGLDPRSSAMKKFKAAEHRCKRQNQKRRAKRKRFDQYAQYWAYARSYIHGVLGDSPDLESIYEKCDITSGAAIGVHGSKTNLMRKLFAEEWSVTPTALFHAKRALWANTHYRDAILPGGIVCYDPILFSRIVEERATVMSHNKISFVPKTAKSHRTIAVEPLLNSLVMKGIDEEMRGRLRRYGIDLSDQETNQVLAHKGSLGGFNPYVTIDLAAASDSMSTEVVRDLLPPDWFDLLMEVRAPCYELDGESVRYEKFCSMGNGFCFPLQSLLYASICYAASRSVNADARDFSVYGDDIVVRQQIALLVIELLRDLGFRTNIDKTFVTGPFRESCGMDWYNGQDVRPVHYTEPVTDVRHLFSFHNSTLRSPRAELFFEELRPLLRKHAPRNVACVRPGREPGDSAFSVPLDVAMSDPGVNRDRDSRDKTRPFQQGWSWAEIASKPVSDFLELTEVQLGKLQMCAVLRGSHDLRTAFTLRYNSRPKRVRVSRPHYEDYDCDPVKVERVSSNFASIRELRKALWRQPLTPYPKPIRGNAV